MKIEKKTPVSFLRHLGGLRNKINKIESFRKESNVISEEIDEILKLYTDFEAHIVFQPSDGWCILNEKTYKLITFETFFEALNDKEFVSEEDFEEFLGF